MSGKQFESGARQQRATSQLEPLTVTAHRVMWETRIPLRAEFRFDTTEPLLVTVVFRPADGPAVTWQISRDLLCDGLLQSSGIGDVRVWPVRHRGRPLVRVRLEARGSTALFEINLHVLEDWLTRTCELVAPGEELDGVDWDAVVAGLLEDR
ncbi:SsgA family sporulation/cell division regulator [Streptomyces sp. J2-1]|uniref:SsgA family sporulation/cell division regulator n=1 Tax=Streptomyces corallincola TaxID=2851888 RepID=UPI001C384F70|nr:SsgA family sporulation/cell division regulator [Streptomyces corallincola]MBV2353882.1 SsgA family sporulation/cell division regulator [Streptomyces corallincola]